MHRLLLTGAGFSRNWGGWLGSEAFEWLLGSEKILPRTRDMLWEKRNRGGFEEVLAMLQQSTEREPLDRLMEALRDMFDAMNAGLRGKHFEDALASWLGSFEAIFTLNQDLLLELNYQGPQRLGDGWGMPGVRAVAQTGFGERRWAGMHAADEPATFKEWPNSQPYFKLHGSSNFVAANGSESMLIMGGNKEASINRHPLLAWYSTRFAEYLLRPDTRLIVVGYSFRDDHINNLIMAAAAAGGLRLFIVDPQGVDILDPLAGQPGPRDRNPLIDLVPFVWGASRRSLSAIFSDDLVELSKLSRFLAA